MADKKILNTRIRLKYDTLQAWNDSNLVLGAGELAIATVPTVEGSTLEPVMLKVGDGSKTFSELDFVSAKAADVYGWAKEDLNAFNARVNALINGALNGEGAATIKGYVTESDFNEFKTTLETRLQGIEADVRAIKDDYTTEAEAGTIAQGKVDVLKGTAEDAAGTVTVYGALASAAAADAKAEQNKTDIAAINTAIGKLDDTFASEEELENVRADLQGKIDAKVAQADYDVKVKALEDADKALDERVQPLETDVAQLKTDAATHATKTELADAVAALKAGENDTADSETIAGAKKYADKKVDDLLKAYILDEENGGTTDAIDKLQEIAAWITDDAAGAAKIVADVAALDTNKLDKQTFNEFKSGDFADVVADAAHTNREELDKIAAGDKDKWDKAVTNLDTHTKDTVAHITADERTKWNDVVNKASQTDLNTHITDKENPHEVTAAQVGAYTTGEADAKFATLAGLADGTTVAKEATHAANADNATNAVNAEKATADAAGNDIAATYETKTNVAAVEARVKALEDEFEFIIDCGSSTEVVFDFPVKAE